MSIAQASAQRRINDFQRTYGERALHLAYHAALPVALDADLLHLLRINFFLDPPEPLPFTAESDLLLSPLCQEIAEGLYEIEAETRNILLQGFALTYQQTDRLQEVATLLWRYVDEVAPWADRVELERAQQLTALSFLAPNQAQQWLTHAEQSSGRTMPVEREWFVAMGYELSRHKPAEILPANLDLALRDLRLPKEVIDLLTPIFHSLGFKLEGQKLYDANNLSLQFTVIHKDNEPERVLLYLPSWLIDETHPVTIDKVAASTSIFDPETRVFIMCDGIDVLPLPYQTVIDEIWIKHHRLQVTFVPWRVIEQLKTSDEPDSALSVLLVDSQFKLNIVQGVSGKSRTQLVALRKVLASLYDTEEDARRVVVDTGINSARIDFPGYSETRWHIVLTEAEKEGKLLLLLDVVLKEYPKNEELRKVAQYWLDPITPLSSRETVHYDVFISYSSQDKRWVRGELLRRLEAAGLKICIDFRDFQPGAPRITEIERGILTSRTTLLVLTPAYLTSSWTEFETLLLQTTNPTDRLRRLTLLLKEHCELPKRLRFLTYVDFTNLSEYDLAWRKLLTSLDTALPSALSPQPTPSLLSSKDTARYDVFISYSVQDAAWVRGELLTRLEAAGLKIFIDFRDFQLGAPSITEIERGIQTSRKTLLVLTPAYLVSNWTEFEPLLLQTSDPINRTQRLILLLKERCNLPIRIRFLAYADFTNPAERDLAWRNLLTSLGAALPSTSASVFIQLRTVLAHLYPDEASATIIALDAGLLVSKISFSGRAISHWHAILSEAINQGRLANLLECVQKDFTTNPELFAAIAAVEDLLSSGGHLTFEYEARG